MYVGMLCMCVERGRSKRGGDGSWSLGRRWFRRLKWAGRTFWRRWRWVGRVISRGIMRVGGAEDVDGKIFMMWGEKCGA